MNILQGKAWKFGDGISTDHITPGRLFHLRSNPPELAKHILEDERPDFIRDMEPGDFIVGGRNFGQGSSREHAPLCIRLAGVGAVVATSFARIFYRNCANVGLLAITLDTRDIGDGDRLAIEPGKGRLLNRTRDREYEFSPLPEVMRRILDAGGLVSFVNERGGFQLS